MEESIAEYAERMRTKAGVKKQSGNAFPVAPGLSLFNASKGDGAFRKFRDGFEEHFFRTPGRKRLATRRGLSNAELFEEIEAGKRPDTLIVRGMCVRWFVTNPIEDGGEGLLAFITESDGRRDGQDVGESTRVVAKIFERFGELGSHSITVEDKSKRSKSKYAKKVMVKKRCKHIDLVFELSSRKATDAEAWADMTFDCFVQFRRYSAFLAASRALVGSSFMCTKFDHADSVPCEVEVDFKGHFTKEALRKRAIQASLHYEEQERLALARRKKAQLRVRSMRGILKKKQQNFQDAIESFELMVEVMEKLRLRCEAFSGGRKYAGDMESVAVDPIRELMISCEERQSQVIELLAEASSDLAPKNKADAGADSNDDGAPEPIERAEEALRAFQESIAQFRKNIARSDKELRLSLSEISNRLPTVEEALVAQTRGRESSCATFIEMMVTCIEQGHMMGALSPFLPHKMTPPLLPLANKCGFIPVDKSWEDMDFDHTTDPFWGLHFIDGCYLVEDFQIFSNGVETIDKKHVLRVRLDSDGEWVVEARERDNVGEHWSTPAKVIRQNLKCENGTMLHVVDRRESSVHKKAHPSTGNLSTALQF